jgi:hypothetical protein
MHTHLEFQFWFFSDKWKNSIFHYRKELLDILKNSELNGIVFDRIVFSASLRGFLSQCAIHEFCSSRVVILLDLKNANIKIVQESLYKV